MLETMTIHRVEVPANATDLRIVTEMLAAVRGAADTGAAILGRLGSSAADFATRPWRIGERVHDWVCAPTVHNAGVILYMHGRRFQHDEPAEVYAARLSAAAALPVLSARYRLAPRHPYPAALDDVVDAYRALLRLGFPAHQIALVGHSAGATLVLSALLRLQEGGEPMPACAVAISPITDFSLGGATLTSNSDTDIVDIAEIHQVRDAYLAGADPAGSPQSPLAGNTEGMPPLLLACGDAEILYDDAHRFADKTAAAGGDVTLEVHQGMPHGFAVMNTDSAAELLARVGVFVNGRLNGGLPAGRSSSGAVRRGAR